MNTEHRLLSALAVASALLLLSLCYGVLLYLS